MTLQEQIADAKVIAVLTIDSVENAVPLARTLLEGGIRAMELTLRTPQAMECLVRIVSEVPEMLAGVGTIIRPEQVRAAKANGAAFAVSPGTNRTVLEEARQAGLFFAPGIATPSDIETALEFDCSIMKFFPAETSGGLPYLKSMAAPYSYLGLRFIPLGGLNEGNLQRYLSDPLIAAIGGSWIASPEEIRNAQWDTILKRAGTASRLAAEA
ncbi:MAG: bifunctional 4-hydroxy-2-oxoglutarate aldolase/2-dehydro-3-deoxy-phosphogluconate aldolase [Kiritimatiellales bacterium]|nr:bifunctional 4-hydroxy-2-oxoglutarate aldolase/2-dehydro-3-deoxy-phosphogluconate aldolase [Kiritimatiellales bacterium]MCF7863895.1 bifunctional 4-hydroxy-2-oxoglutarate aldolase/2-dehydro-3-deoxy-phosphogluconate aldolase [Kiritimatiellales bacterium]